MRYAGGLTAIHKEKKCVVCGKTFLPGSGAQRFCGRICRSKVYIRRTK